MEKKDSRYDEVKKQILTGKISQFNEIFSFIPEEIVAHDLGLSLQQLTELKQHVGNFEMGRLFTLSQLIGIDLRIVAALAYTQQILDVNLN